MAISLNSRYPGARVYPLHPGFSGNVKVSDKVPSASREEEEEPAAPIVSRSGHWRKALLSLLLVPVLPIVGYYGMDATGMTDRIAESSPAMQRILGEGFGHAGLCFSLHYVVQAGRHAWLAMRRKPKN